MQTVLIVLACVVGLLCSILGGLYVAGRRGNGATHETSIEIAAPPERVWLWLSDGERVKQWVGGLKSIEPLTPDKGLEVGARDRLLVEVNGQQFELFAEITHVEEGRALAQRLTQSGPFAWHEEARFTLQPGANATTTRFVVTASYTYTTVPGVIMEPLIRVAARKKLNEDLARLKSFVEEP